MDGQGGDSYAKLLGAEIRNRRMARGMPLRALAKQLNLSGHGGLVDYEHGRRIPPENLIEGCERVLQVPDGALRNLREKALAERADRESERLLRSVEPAPPPEPATEPRRRPVRRLWVIAGVVVLAAGLGFGAWQWLSPGAPSAGPTRFGFEDGTERWSPLWGNKLVQLRTTSITAYEGAQSLQITTTGASNGRDKAIGTTHGIETLRSGMKVTMFLRVSGPVAASVRFFAYDSKSQPHWAPETPIGGEAALPARPDWTRYSWTVPVVDKVQAIGMEIYQNSDDALTVWADAVGW